jgi:cytochrome c551/c552
MKKFIIISAALLFFAFVVIQFFQPEKNISEKSENLVINTENLPPALKEALKNACLDCHSDNTKYVWYHKIAPVSWMINKHITDGKKELNLSEWKILDDYDKIKALEDMKQEIERETMPLKPYVLMHPEAKLDEETKKAMIAWIDKKSEELMNQPEE